MHNYLPREPARPIYPVPKVRNDSIYLICVSYDIASLLFPGPVPIVDQSNLLL